MFKKPDSVFITYTHPGDQKRRANRRAVSSFVSKSYRPTSRKIVFERSHYLPFLQAQRECTTTEKSSAGTPTTENSVVLQPGSANSKELSALDSAEQTTHAPSGPPEPPTDDSSLSPRDPWLVDKLASRFIPALNTDRRRYEGFVEFATRNAECYNALLAQAYYHIDAGGFGNPHWRTLYHRGEAMKLLREKMQSCRTSVFDDCYAIFTTTMLLSVEYAHTDHTAWLLHKRALESMVTDKGGPDKLSCRLRDEMLRNEFFLQVLVNGRVAVCEWAGAVKLCVQDYYPMDDIILLALPPVFRALAQRRALSTAAARFVIVILSYLARSGRYQHPALQYGTYDPLDVGSSESELEVILHLVDSRKSEYVEHQACLALLIFVFNLHNQAGSHEQHMEILDDAATEMITIKNGGPLAERKCLCWSIAAVGAAAATESPWRLDIPFMGHIIQVMARGDDKTAQLRKMLHCYYLYGANPQMHPERHISSAVPV